MLAYVFFSLALGSEGFLESVCQQGFMSMLLCGQSIEGVNEASMFAAASNRSCVLGGGSCSVEGAQNAGPLWDLSGVHGKAGIDTEGVGGEKDLFISGCATILSVEPVLWKNGRAYSAKGRVMVRAVTGCRIRDVNGTWVNSHGQSGGGMHGEYASKIQETVRVSVNGRLCHQKTRILPYGEKGFSSVYAECKIEDENVSIINVETICEAHIMVDSAYLVMGWTTRCDRDAIERVIADRCKKSFCLGRNPGSDSKRGCQSFCDSVAWSLSKSSCMPTKSEKALCPNPVKEGFGYPGLGSSEYRISKPKYTDYCKRYCIVEDDPTNACLNNRVWLDYGHKMTCSDEIMLYSGDDIDLECGGWHFGSDGVLHAELELCGVGSATAFEIGGVLHRHMVPAPMHMLYPFEGGDETEKTVLSILEGPYGNLSGIPQDRLFFSGLELVQNPSAPVIGEGIELVEPEFSNGCFRTGISFWNRDDPLSVRMHIVDISERVSNLFGKPCTSTSDCPKDNACLDERCLELSGLSNSITLGECLKKARKSTLNASCGRTSCTLFLFSEAGPIKSADIYFSCLGGPGGRLLTDEGGVAVVEFELSGQFACHAAFDGLNGYAPSAVDFRYVGLGGETVDLRALLALALLLGIVKHAIRRKSLWGIATEFRGWLP